jgi:hypothetical protein
LKVFSGIEVLLSIWANEVVASDEEVSIATVVSDFISSVVLDNDEVHEVEVEVEVEALVAKEDVLIHNRLTILVFGHFANSFG